MVKRIMSAAKRDQIDQIDLTYVHFLLNDKRNQDEVMPLYSTTN